MTKRPHVICGDSPRADEEWLVGQVRAGFGKPWIGQGGTLRTVELRGAYPDTVLSVDFTARGDLRNYETEIWQWLYDEHMAVDGSPALDPSMVLADLAEIIDGAENS